MLSHTILRVPRSLLRRGAVVIGVTSLCLAAARPAHATTFITPTQACTIGDSSAGSPVGDCFRTPEIGEYFFDAQNYATTRVVLRFDASPSSGETYSFSSGCEGVSDREDYHVYPLTTDWDYNVDWGTTDGSTAWTTPGALDDVGTEIAPEDDADILTAPYGVLVTRPDSPGVMLCNPAVAVDSGS